MTQSLDRLIKPDCTWDLDAMPQGVRPNPEKIAIDNLQSANPVHLTYSHGRLIEALLELYLATRQSGALELASRLASFHLRGSTLPDGGIPQADWVHHHSLFGTYRGLLLFGETTGQRSHVDRVLACYRATVRTRVNESGFIPECWGRKSGGETSSPGDAAQIALALAGMGHAECLDDAERWVRACLLPSQFTEPLDVVPAVEDGRDEHSWLGQRVLGAYGGVYREPYGGKRPTTDVTAATLHSLCDVYTHVAQRGPEGVRINFHFDYEDQWTSIRTDEGDARRVSIRTRGGENLFIRVPGWADEGSLIIESGGRRLDCHRIGVFAFVPREDNRGEVSVSYDLPIRETREEAAGRSYDLTWRGDSVLSVSPAPDLFPFYAG